MNLTPSEDDLEREQELVYGLLSVVGTAVNDAKREGAKFAPILLLQARTGDLLPVPLERLLSRCNGDVRLAKLICQNLAISYGAIGQMVVFEHAEEGVLAVGRTQNSPRERAFRIEDGNDGVPEIFPDWRKYADIELQQLDYVLPVHEPSREERIGAMKELHELGIVNSDIERSVNREEERRHKMGRHRHF